MSMIRTSHPGQVAESTSLADALASGGPYQGYAYSYPHKTAYRWFDAPLDLASLWRNVDTSSTFLYAHVPFCEMRCGFCNLFTTTDTEDRADRFIEALERQARVVTEALPHQPTITSAAIGGGTPTILSVPQIHALFELLRTSFGLDPARVPVSVETSPQTATDERVAAIGELGVSRWSIGVQSWFADELRSMGRPQNIAEAHDAVQRLRNSNVARLNIDLIYGAHGQTTTTIEANIAETLRHEPDEVFLYPLYVRPLTGLGRNAAREWDDQRIALYRAGRDALLSNGFAQVSMRMFARNSTGHAQTDHAQTGHAQTGHAQTGCAQAERSLTYDCQADPMIGLGPGARSYTPTTHYSSDWAVSRNEVGGIIDRFIDSSNDAFARAEYGVALTRDDRMRRFVLQGLLHETGIVFERYVDAFNADLFADFPQLRELESLGLAATHSEGLHLTDAGIEQSDAIGPWLYSAAVRESMSGFEIR